MLGQNLLLLLAVLPFLGAILAVTMPVGARNAEVLLAGAVMVAGLLGLAPLAGEVADGGVVVGVGLNVSTRADELPGTGTSLVEVTGRAVDRAPVLLAYLRALETRYRRWVEHAGDPVSSGLAADYLSWCSTVGADVVVTLPDGSSLEGVAEAVPRVEVEPLFADGHRLVVLHDPIGRDAPPEPARVEPRNHVRRTEPSDRRVTRSVRPDADDVAEGAFVEVAPAEVSE